MTELFGWSPLLSGFNKRSTPKENTAPTWLSYREHPKIRQTRPCIGDPKLPWFDLDLNFFLTFGGSWPLTKTCFRSSLDVELGWTLQMTNAPSEYRQYRSYSYGEIRQFVLDAQRLASSLPCGQASKKLWNPKDLWWSDGHGGHQQCKLMQSVGFAGSNLLSGVGLRPGRQNLRQQTVGQTRQLPCCYAMVAKVAALGITFSAVGLSALAMVEGLDSWVRRSCFGWLLCQAKRHDGM